MTCHVRGLYGSSPENSASRLSRVCIQAFGCEHPIERIKRIAPRTRRVVTSHLVLHIYRHREDIIIAPDRVMTVNAVSACEVRRMPIGLQIGTDPSPPAPTCRSLILCAVANHELNLNELSGLDHSAWIPLFVPGDLLRSWLHPATD
jgi:hypothetical protein